MGRQEILKILEEVYPRSLSVKQLADLIGTSKPATSKNVRLLLKDGSIEITGVIDAQPKKYRIFGLNKI